MFSCFGLRARQKTLGLSVSNCGELQVAVATRDGVPLNFHNHHNKYALFQYYNTLQRSSFHSSRRNSQSSCSSVNSNSKHQKNVDLRPKSEGFFHNNNCFPDGLKITDIDSYTTDIVKSGDDCISVGNGANLMKKCHRSSNKRRSHTLPKNIGIEDSDDGKHGRVYALHKKKRSGLFELFSSNKEGSVVCSEETNSNSPLETAEMVKSSPMELLQYSTKDKSLKSDKCQANHSEKVRKKQVQNRSFSPTNLDSFLADNRVKLDVPSTISVSNLAHTNLYKNSTDFNVSAQSSPSSINTLATKNLMAQKSEGTQQPNSNGTRIATKKNGSDIVRSDVPVIAPIIDVKAQKQHSVPTKIPSLSKNEKQLGIVYVHDRASHPPVKEDSRNNIFPVISEQLACAPCDIVGTEEAKNLANVDNNCLPMSNRGFHAPTSNANFKNENLLSCPHSDVLHEGTLLLSDQDNMISKPPHSGVIVRDSSISSYSSAKSYNGNLSRCVTDVTRNTCASQVTATELLTTTGFDDSSIPMIDDEDTVSDSSTTNDTGLTPVKPVSKVSKIPSYKSLSNESSVREKIIEQKTGRTENAESTSNKLQELQHRTRNQQLNFYNAAKTSRAPRTTPVASEVQRLEAALTARTCEAEAARREAQLARQEACAADKGLQALTVIVHHLTHQYEAFDCPGLKSEIARLQESLVAAEQTLGDREIALAAAETKLSEEQARASLEQLQLSEQHERDLLHLKQQQELVLQQLKERQQQELLEITAQHDERAASEQKKHHLQIQTLQEEHRNLVCELTSAHKSREEDLQAQILCAEKESEKLRERNSKLQESLLSDSDHRLVGIRQHCSDLQKEVESLKSVVEMRNSDLHKLRAQVAGMEQLERELEAARHHANTLNAKTEDLNAQINTKSQTERQLMQSNQQLKEAIDRESSANKQLRLENEQLQWKLRQREQLSQSLPVSTIDGMTKQSQLHTSWEDRPSSLHHHQHEYRELQQQSYLRRSESMKTERRLLTSSPVCGCDARTSSREHGCEPSNSRTSLERFSPPASPRVKAVVEKCNSVSFVLDLNDSLSNENILEPPSSPRLKHDSLHARNCVRKSRSSSLEKKNQVSRNNSLSKCTSAGNFYTRHHGRHCIEGIASQLVNDSDCDERLQLPPQPPCSRSREHTTSESSCTESIERISPQSSSWSGTTTNGSTGSPNMIFDGNFSSFNHLQHPEEDEYEENLEDSEESFIAGIPTDLTPLVNLMNASSSSPSDSEMSRCGSHAEVTPSESDDENSLAQIFDGVQGSLPQGHEWVAAEGAGEAMVPSDLVSNVSEVNESANPGNQSSAKRPSASQVVSKKS